jgi:hypothetical protein
MNRITALRDYSTNHSIYRRQAAKLTGDERAQIEAFIQENDQLDCLAFEKKATRLYVDTARPKKSIIMVELLLVANRVAYMTTSI